MDFGIDTIREIADKDPAIKILVVLIICDILCGAAVSAVIDRSLSSSASLKGMTKKIAMLLLVFICKYLEPIVQGVPLGMIAAVFYCGTELISITENMKRLGVPIPKAVNDALEKLRRNEEDTIEVPAQRLRTKKPPSDYIDLPQHVPKDPKGTADQEGTTQPGRPSQTGDKHPLNVQDKRSTQTGGSEK